MTEILMCEMFHKKMHWEQIKLSWMQLLRDPNMNGTYIVHTCKGVQ